MELNNLYLYRTSYSAFPRALSGILLAAAEEENKKRIIEMIPRALIKKILSLFIQIWRVVIKDKYNDYYENGDNESLCFLIEKA